MRSFLRAAFTYRLYLMDSIAFVSTSSIDRARENALLSLLGWQQQMKEGRMSLK